MACGYAKPIELITHIQTEVVVLKTLNVKCSADWIGYVVRRDKPKENGISREVVSPVSSKVLTPTKIFLHFNIVGHQRFLILIYCYYLLPSLYPNVCAGKTKQLEV